MYEKTTLPNGLRILTSAMPTTRSVTIVFYVGAGSRYEVPEQAGISHFVEHLLFKGSRRYPQARDISETIDRVGGMLNAATDREVTSYWCKVARPHFSIALDLLTDMLRHPLIESQELEKERLVIVEELRMTKDDPSSRAEALLDELLWPNHALGRDVGGTEESVMAISRDAMLEYMARQYSPQNIVVSVAGDISHQEVVAAVSRAFGDWKPSHTLTWEPSVDSQTAPHLKMESRKSDQAHLFLGLKGLSTTHPDRYALDLLSAILGEGMSSRLFQEVRESRALAYDVHSYTNHLLDCGSFNVYSGVDPHRAKEAVEAILQVLHGAKDEVPESELRKVKELTRGRMLLRMEDTRAVAAWIGAQELLHNEIKTVDDVVAEVEAITPAQVQRVANQLLVTEKLNLILVGPRRAEGPFLRLLKL
ncbi:MAG: insulinase family protein [Dehalococcoidia bacterium]|nr:insulinase family protein [Dehalococcoidia bacterium]